jgi:hypothetical protein
MNLDKLFRAATDNEVFAVGIPPPVDNGRDSLLG